ncbi:MAG: MoaD/ThiS family protein [Gemmatimonadota bacterium]
MAAIRIRLFGVYRELSGESEASAELPPGSTAEDLMTHLRSQPCFRMLPTRPLVAVNLRYVELDHPLQEGDEVAIIPPVAGG